MVLVLMSKALNQSTTQLISPWIIDAKKKNEPIFELEKILLNNIQQCLILNCYETNSVLNKKCHNLLVEIIIKINVINL